MTSMLYAQVSKPLRLLNDTLLIIDKRVLTDDFLLAARVETLSSEKNKAQLTAGQRLYDPLWVFLRKQKDFLYVEKSNSRKGREIVVRLSIVQETDSNLCVDWTALLYTPLEMVDPFSGKMAPGQLLAHTQRILGSKQFDDRVEASVQSVYLDGKRKFTTSIRKELALLPRQRMPARAFDERVGFAYLVRQDTVAKPQRIIKRFDIRPATASDSLRHARGETVVPAKPIVFYLDSCFPEHWKAAIRTGVLDWNDAFSAIGFRDVIRVENYPACQAFDSNDGRNHCIRYVNNEFPNAMGKHWVDPRTGEILQADIFIYRPVIDLLKRWYFLQTAAYNPLARYQHPADSVEFRLIRYAVAHEMGHCLGLEHNYRASYGYSVKLLRDARVAAEYGTTPSIMDYARFNYVARKRDKVRHVYPPVLGIYDRYAIRVGYAFLPLSDADRIMRQWIDERQSDPMYCYRRLIRGVIPADPTIQSTDLGNDVFISSRQGIRHLKYIVRHRHKWGDTSALASDTDIQKAYFSYLRHMIPYIGASFLGDDRSEQIYISRKKSERMVRFIIDELNEGYRFGGRLSLPPGEQEKMRRELADLLHHPTLLQHISANAGVTGFTPERYRQLLRALSCPH